MAGYSPVVEPAFVIAHATWLYVTSGVMYYPDDDSEILETFPDGKSLGAKAATDVNQAAVPAKHGSRGECRRSRNSPVGALM